MKNKLVHYFIIGIFCSLYFLVATISMINSVAFFDITHNGVMSWVLAVAFELGAAASLGAIIILDRTSKTMVWTLFILLTLFQMMANSYHAFINLENYVPWVELLGLEESEIIVQKRILSIISGAILPIIALGFIKSLVDYIRPDELEIVSAEEVKEETNSVDTVIEEPNEVIAEIKPKPRKKITKNNTNVKKKPVKRIVTDSVEDIEDIKPVENIEEVSEKASEEALLDEEKKNK